MSIKKYTRELRAYVSCNETMNGWLSSSRICGGEGAEVERHRERSGKRRCGGAGREEHSRVATSHVLLALQPLAALDAVLGEDGALGDDLKRVEAAGRQVAHLIGNRSAVNVRHTMMTWYDGVMTG